MSTLAQFRTMVAATIGLDNTDGSTEQGYIDRWVNRGVLEMLRRTRLKVVIAHLDLTSGSKDYELPSGILFITRIVDANSEPLTEIALDEMYELRRASSSSAGVTYQYALNGANMLMVYPTPTAADTLTFYYVPRPTTLATGTDDPSTATLGGIPSEYHRTIELYALYRAADYADDASSQQGDRYLRDFTGEIAQIRRDMHRKGGPGLPPARLVQRGSRPPRDPSVSRV